MGTDLVTFLEGLAPDPSADVDALSLSAQADLKTAHGALLGGELLDEDGEAAIRSGSRVPVEIVVSESGSRRLHLDGELVSKTLQDLDIDPSGQLADPLTALDIYIDYPVRS